MRQTLGDGCRGIATRIGEMRVLGAATFLSVLLLAGAASGDQAGLYRPEVKKTDDGIAYVSAGIGFDSRANLPRFPLKIVFATTRGEYLADITTEFRRSGGGRPIIIYSPGPWLLVDLPAGTYELKARMADGKESGATVTVVKGRTTDVKLVWRIS